VRSLTSNVSRKTSYTLLTSATVVSSLNHLLKIEEALTDIWSAIWDRVPLPWIIGNIFIFIDNVLSSFGSIIICQLNQPALYIDELI